MIISFEKSLVLLFLFCYVSTYFAIGPVYIPLFILFSILVFVKFIIEERGKLKQNLLTHFSVILLIILNALVIFYFKRSDSSFVILLKLITNYFWLLSAILLFARINISQYLILIERTFTLIILLTFIQVFINVVREGLWLSPLHQESSISAFAIIKPGVLFGGNQKNIWATKFVFSVITYFSGVFFRCFTPSVQKRILFTFLSIFSIFYLTSRTAQMIFILFSMILIWYVYIKKLRFRYKVIGVGIFFGILFYIFPFIFEKLLRLDSDLFDVSKGHDGDGFKARVILWIYLIENIDKINILWGNGILFVDSFFEGIFSESNIHNAYVNIWLDMGISGILLFFILVFKTFNFKINGSNLIYLSGIPFGACLLVQYIGYDNDIVMYLAIIMIYKFLYDERNSVQEIRNIK